ncbi:MAG: hypothetical protein ABGZ17_28375 [Planctomycetaceae bacterium]
MQRIGITISRTATTAWAGAAVIFVLTAIREVTAPEFDSVVKSQLALLRFPIYYVMAAVCLSFGIAGASLALIAERRYRKQLLVFLGLAVTAAAMMVVDFMFIYRPLQEMTSILDRARPAEFHRYHQLSRTINAVDVGLCWLAAMVINWPVSQSDTQC